MPKRMLTSNDEGRQLDADAYNSKMAEVLGPDARRSACRIEKSITVDLTPVNALIDCAATVARDIISENIEQLRHIADRDEYLGRRGDALCATYTRDFDLHEAGHLDAVEAQIAGKLLQRAQQKFQKPEAANLRGLALLDIHLRDAVNAIKPMLAKQTSLFDAPAA